MTPLPPRTLSDVSRQRADTLWVIVYQMDPAPPPPHTTQISWKHAQTPKARPNGRADPAPAVPLPGQPHPRPAGAERVALLPHGRDFRGMPRPQARYSMPSCKSTARWPMPRRRTHRKASAEGQKQAFASWRTTAGWNSHGAAIATNSNRMLRRPTY